MYIDGHADSTDLGSWVCVRVRMEQTYNKYQIRDYVGLSDDIAKLPTYDDLATGSKATCADTGDVYYYVNDDKWYKM